MESRSEVFRSVANGGMHEGPGSTKVIRSTLIDFHKGLPP